MDMARAAFQRVASTAARHHGSSAQLLAAERIEAAATSLSGLAMWPRLQLDADATIFAESRGPHGETQRSHWQTAMPLLSPTPSRVSDGDMLRVAGRIQLGAEIQSPIKYALRAELLRAHEFSC